MIIVIGILYFILLPTMFNFKHDRIYHRSLADISTTVSVPQYSCPTIIHFDALTNTNELRVIGKW